MKLKQIPSQLTRSQRILFASIASLLSAHPGIAADAVFSSANIGAGSQDTNVGLLSTETYHSAANFGGGALTINGVVFEASGGGNPINGTNWTLGGAGAGPFTGFSSGVTGQLGSLLSNFVYNGNPATLTLNNLIAGKTYVVTSYNGQFGGAGGRVTTVAGSSGASTVYDQNIAAGLNLLRYTFVASSTSEALTFTPRSPGDTWHFYGFSNEQVFNNTWSPNSGSSWNTLANWSTGVVPNAVGANASFSAQAGPTNVSFTSSRTAGHVEFLGTGSYTVNGSTLKLQADAGGVSVLNTPDALGSHTIESLVQLASDTVKFGAGTLTLNNEVFGTKSLSVNGGTLRFGITNSYTGGTSVGAGATLDLNNTNQPVGALNGAGTVVNDTAGTSVLTVDSGNFTGVIRDHNTGSGIVALTKVTNGMLTLTTPQTYTGTTTISGGTLRARGTETNTVLLTDNFTATGNPNTADLNFNLASRQTGSLALQNWTPNGNTQVGNATAVQQPAGTNGDYLLLAFGATASLSGLPLNTTNFPGPVKVGFDMFKGNSGDATEWTSFTIRSTPNGFPIGQSGEVGFLYRRNTGIQVFNNNGLIQDYASTTGGDHFEFYLADADGTGSPFGGNGTKLVITQGGLTIGGYRLDTGFGPNSVMNFGSAGGMIGGVDNLAISNSFSYTTNRLAPTTNLNLDTAGAAFELLDTHQTVATIAGVAGTAINIGPLSKLTVNAATPSTFSGSINGMLGSLVKAGPSTLELNATSSYGGGTTIAGGAVFTHAPDALGTGAISVAAGANFLPWYNGGTPVIKNNFALNGLGGNPGDGDKGAIYADGGGGGYSEYVFIGKIALAATSDISGNNLNNQRLVGQVTGPGGLTKGSGRGDENSALILSNTANDYAGNTTIKNGTVRLGASQVIPDGPGKGVVIMSAGTTLDLAGNSETINNLSGLGAIITNPAVVISAPVFFNDDAGTGISATKIYSHALDFAEANPLTINGVSFTGAGLSGGNWTLAGTNGTAGNGSTGASGNISTLLTNFFYNGNPATLTLTGLTPGTNYDLRIYQRLWGGDRTQLFAFNAGASTGATIYNEDASATPSYLSFRYIADATGTATLNTTQLGAGTYHWFGLTNEEVVPNATPNPVLTVGDATDSTYSGAITGALEINKVGTGTLSLNGALTFDTLDVDQGRVNIGNATLNSLEIADGAIVVLTTTLAAPAPDALLAGASAQAVPEPGSLALLFGGALALMGRRRRV